MATAKEKNNNLDQTLTVLASNSGLNQDFNINFSNKAEEKLKKVFDIEITPSEIERIVEAELLNIGTRQKIQGFRPGKVPLNILRTKFIDEVYPRVRNEIVSGAIRGLVQENKLSMAIDPKIKLENISQDQGIKFEVEIEILPEIIVPDFSKVKVENYTLELSEKDTEEALTKLVLNMAKSKIERGEVALEEYDNKHKAVTGNILTIDFEGKIDGVLFEGGKAENAILEIGAKRFIEGFEEQLIGSKIGESKTIKVTFPKAYHYEKLAGKNAEFDIKVHKISNIPLPAIDDKLAEDYGFKTLDELKVKIKEQLHKENDKIAFIKAKKNLFDELELICKFDVPSGMVAKEFEGLWNEVERAKKQNPSSIEKSDEELKADYQKIANRRVKLGLLISELGKIHKIQVSEAELREIIGEELAKYPGQEKEFIEFLNKNPQAVENFRAPIIEDKIVKKIFEEVKSTVKKVTLKELAEFNS